jgi:hypothetical protein
VYTNFTFRIRLFARSSLVRSNRDSKSQDGVVTVHICQNYFFLTFVSSFTLHQSSGSMPCLPKGLKQQDTAITKHGFGENNEETRVAIRTLLRRYENLFDATNNVTRARQGAPRSERMRGVDIKGIGQMVGKSQIERSKVLANTQAKRVRTILASLAQLVLHKGGVDEAEVHEAFCPNNVDIASIKKATTMPLMKIEMCASWSVFAAREHGGGTYSEEEVTRIASLLTKYGAEFDDTWRARQKAEGKSVENSDDENGVTEQDAEPDAKKQKVEPSLDRLLRKKQSARMHAKLQADRNRVVTVALAKTLLRKGDVTDKEIVQSLRASPLSRMVETETNTLFEAFDNPETSEIYIAIPVAECADNLFDY